MGKLTHVAVLVWLIKDIARYRKTIAKTEFSEKDTKGIKDSISIDDNDKRNFIV